MCDTHGTHVTVVNGAVRCVLCGHRVGFRKKLRLRDMPRELLDRHEARKRWWNWPRQEGGVFYY